MHSFTLILSFAAAVQCAPNPDPKTRHVVGGAVLGLGAATLWNQHNQIEDLKAQQAQQPSGAQFVSAIPQPPQPQVACLAPVVVVNGVPIQSQMVNGVPTVHFQA